MRGTAVARVAQRRCGCGFGTQFAVAIYIRLGCARNFDDTFRRTDIGGRCTAHFDAEAVEFHVGRTELGRARNIDRTFAHRTRQRKSGCTREVDFAPAAVNIGDEPAEPQPAVPVAEKSANNDVFGFSFFGTDCRVQRFDMQRPALENCTEESVAALWEKFAAAGYAPVIAECSKLKKSLRLNDWGYLRLLASLADAWYTPDSNEATLLRTFLAVQSGYEVRIAQSSGHLLMLFPCDEQIYRRRYVSLDGTRYYMFDTRGDSSKCRVFDKSFGGGNRISLRMTEIPHIADKPSPMRTLQSKKYPDMKMDATININLIDYFDSYPNCDLEIYRIPTFSGSINDGLKSIKRAIASLDTKDAVAKILDFVQTAFDYQTDAEQFGYERSFFAEETLYYPYCDCEDRAILFSALVENLTGLDTVLLQYTGHVAAAVCFDSDVAGDSVTVNGRRYTVCDPTYIGAGIGCSMPGLDNKSISIVRK